MQPTLLSMYKVACAVPSDNNEHCPTLHALAQECLSITEFGVMFGRSTVSFLSAGPEKLVSYDICKQDVVNQIEALAQAEGINFQFITGDSRVIDIDMVDLLYIDTDHTYEQLKIELFRHSEKARKYIVLHDTTAFPEMWQAVEEFLLLETFFIKEKYENNNGLTILQRIGG